MSVLLLQRAGDVVAKDELLKQVWHDAFVEDGSLTRTISSCAGYWEKAAKRAAIHRHRIAARLPGCSAGEKPDRNRGLRSRES